VFVRQALLLVVLLTLFAGVDTSTSSAAEPSCAAGLSALERHDPAGAEKAFRDVLEGEARSACAIAGLAKVTATVHAEEFLCAEGKALAAKGEGEKAKRRYAAALARNTHSKCATKGLETPKAEEKEGKTGAEKWEAKWKAIFAGIGIWAAAILVALAAFAIGVFAILRHFRASLAIEPFSDDAVEVKVGAVVAGLVRKRLTELSTRTSQSSGPIKLDFIVADVELLAENDSLEKALGGLAEVSQLKFIVALLGLIDRTSRRRMVAKGDLAAAGDEGPGLVLDLQSGSKGVQAGEAVWDGEATTDDAKAGPYYALADRAAAWLQYEVARGLKASVGNITRNAQSFSLTGEALAEQRLGKEEDAADSYADALERDPENVAALVNLAMIMARVDGDYKSAIGLLSLARTALLARYREGAAE
jgi:tetratricopeptide (TPR) repeat protein